VKKILFTATLIIVGLSLMAFAPQEKKDAKPAKSEKTKVKGKERFYSYKSEIAPILKKYCLPCHTEDNMNPSELYLDSYENLMKGGKHGKALDIAKPAESILLKKISMKPPFGDPMPMKRKTEFPADTLKMIRTWIEQGAKNN